MVRLRYDGPRTITLWNGKLLEPGGEVEVTDEQAAELLDVYPEEYDTGKLGPLPRDADGKVTGPRPRIFAKEPKAGQPRRPGWSRVGAATTATVDTRAATTEENERRLADLAGAEED
jgi:hypothetical protein